MEMNNRGSISSMLLPLAAVPLPLPLPSSSLLSCSKSRLTLLTTVALMLMVSLSPSSQVHARAAAAADPEPGKGEGGKIRVTPLGITCPPENEEDDKEAAMEEIYYYSDLVVMGKVTARHRQSDRMHTAEMDVYCVYKGNNVPSHISITGAGSVPNLCFSTDFQVGEMYMTYLSRHPDGRLSPAYQNHPENYKDEMTYMCGINITLPQGLSELPANVKCDVDYSIPYDDNNPFYEDIVDEEESANVTCFSFDPSTRKDDTYKHADAKEKDEGEAKKGQVQDGDDRNGCGGPLGLSLLPFLALAFLHAAPVLFS